MESLFEQTIGDLTSSLGDPTRRGIYLTVRDSPDGSTAGQVAEIFGIHPNVARHHLDRLVAGGYLHVVAPRGGRGSAVGRPAKIYEATDKEINLSYPSRRYDLLADLLARVVEQLDPERGPERAEEIGRQFGLELAAALGIPADGKVAPEVLETVADALSSIGFDVTPDLPSGALVTLTCPFGRTAANHAEVVCRLDQGIVRGLVEATGRTGPELALTPAEGPGAVCAVRI